MCYNFFSFEQYVEKLELIGMDFIWKIAMESPDEEIANEAIQLIINYSYINLNPRLKKVSKEKRCSYTKSNVFLIDKLAYLKVELLYFEILSLIMITTKW